VKKLYIGNLPYQASETDLQNWFVQAGINVDTVTMMRDRYSGEARGFGFVELSDEEANRAIQSCNGKDFLGRSLVVNEARPLREGGGARRGR
jgi:cold-inducible RNA-binding protein